MTATPTPKRSLCCESVSASHRVSPASSALSAPVISTGVGAAVLSIEAILSIIIGRLVTLRARAIRRTRTLAAIAGNAFKLAG